MPSNSTRTAPGSSAVPGEQLAGAQPPASRRRRRIARGPVVIGEPSVAFSPVLAAGEPYRADTIADGGDAFGVTVRAASVRGLTKRWQGEPRQDDLCMSRHEPTGTLIAAVADGVSGAERAHLGAALAVRHAVAALTRQLDAGETIDWSKAFRDAAWALVEAERAAAGNPQAGVLEAAHSLATTLLVAVLTPAPDSDPDGDPDRDRRPAITAPVSVELAGVGDSCALLLRDGRFERLLGAEPDRDGLIGGAVDALPRAVARMRSARLCLSPGGVLLLATDGFGLPLGDGGGEVGAVFARELRRAPSVIEFARLVDFSRSTYDDDRTLIAIWPPPER